jgi:hypothetical protein
MASDGAVLAIKGFIRLALSGAEALLGSLSWQRRREVSRRRRERPEGSGRWLRDDEITLVGTLAALIVPSDETGPGAHEAGVVQTLDRTLAGSPPLQALYEPGLLAFDALARERHGVSFVELPQDRKVDLLGDVDRLSQAVSDTDSMAAKIKGAVLTLRCAANGSLAAARLFPRLVSDVKQMFYTSPVGWEWLGYDGPPMPDGYPGLSPRFSRPPSSG